MADTVEPHEVDALVALVDRLPGLAEAVDEDIVPLLHRLDQIGPDLHHLLEVVADLRKLVARMPGMGRLGRVDGQGDEDEQHLT